MVASSSLHGTDATRANLIRGTIASILRAIGIAAAHFAVVVALAGVAGLIALSVVQHKVEALSAPAARLGTRGRDAEDAHAAVGAIRTLYIAHGESITR